MSEKVYEQFNVRMYSWKDDTCKERARGKIQLWKIGAEDQMFYRFRMVFPPTGRVIGTPLLPCDITTSLDIDETLAKDGSIRMKLGDENVPVAFVFLSDSCSLDDEQIEENLELPSVYQSTSFIFFKTNISKVQKTKIQYQTISTQSRPKNFFLWYWNRKNKLFL